MQGNNKRDPSILPGVFCTEELLAKVGGNLFQLVRVASTRALELDSGRPPLISNPISDKVTTIALEEITQGKVVFLSNKMKDERSKEKKV